MTECDTYYYIWQRLLGKYYILFVCVQVFKCSAIRFFICMGGLVHNCITCASAAESSSEFVCQSRASYGEAIKDGGELSRKPRALPEAEVDSGSGPIHGWNGSLQVPKAQKTFTHLTSPLKRNKCEPLPLRLYLF